MVRVGTKISARYFSMSIRRRKIAKTVLKIHSIMKESNSFHFQLFVLSLAQNSEGNEY
jgi:hypothetical protein